MSFRGEMPRPLPRVPSGSRSPFVLRAELLTLSALHGDDRSAGGHGPISQAYPAGADEPRGVVRREVTAYLRHLAKRRQSAAQEDHVGAVNQELVARSKESGPTSEDQPANPDHQFAPASATSGRNPDVGR